MKWSKRRKANVILLALLVLSGAALIVFSLPDLQWGADETVSYLVRASVPRFAVSLFLLAVMITSGYKNNLKISWKEQPAALLWSVPVFLVALVNFPFSALASGLLIVTRADLMWLHVLTCLSVGLMEELFFRGIFFPLLLEKWKDKRYKVTASALVSAGVFGLFHLLNLFYGAGVGATLMQVGYTFLLGCMLAITFAKTDNIWLCVFTHTLFDVGGTMVGNKVAAGNPWDAVFWVVTVIAGVFCAIHLLLSLRGVEKKYENKE